MKIDFLAKYARIWKENGRLDSGYYEDLDTLYVLEEPHAFWVEKYTSK
jgi:hypothetical protein